jgi:3-deoxy-D-glycero-D-galacto-nononate 9-phosphatase
MSRDIRIVFTDIDGVWTDGGMYYTEAGDIGRLFNTRDSGGLLLLRQAGINVCVISGESSNAVAARMRKLAISDVHLGVSNKTDVAQRVCEAQDLSLNQAAYIGDDLNDIPLLRLVGLSACPADAQYPVNRIASMVLTKHGGEGVFREFSEKLLELLGVLDTTIQTLVDR